MCFIKRKLTPKPSLLMLMYKWEAAEQLQGLPVQLTVYKDEKLKGSLRREMLLEMRDSVWRLSVRRVS